MSRFFTRGGELFEGATSTNDKGRVGYWITKRRCGRCGGAGKAAKWAATGFTCFDCGGAGVMPCEYFVPLYTAEKLAKLNETKAKADAKRAAAAEEYRLAEEARRVADRADVIAAHKPLLDRIAALVDVTAEGFLADMYAQVVERARELSPKQLEAAERSCERIEAERARKANAAYVAPIGAKVTLELTLIRRFTFDRERWENPFAIWTFHDVDGNAVIYKGGNPNALDGVRERGDKVTLTATVKAHDAYNGEPQTIIARPTPIKVKEAA